MLLILTPVIRALLQLVAGGLITDGYLDETAMTAIIGGIVAGITVVWSVIEKKYLTKK